MGLVERQLAEMDRISHDLIVLQRKFDDLLNRVARLEKSEAPLGNITKNTADISISAQGNNDGDIGIGAWVAKGALLQKLATVSFILVFALLLRTVTDNGSIDLRTGTYLGLFYVIALIGVGGWLYARQKVLAPIFSVSGYLLLLSIVIEGTQRFNTISYHLAYGLLFTALGVCSLISLRAKAARFLTIVVIGVGLSVFIFNFPRLIFPAGAMLLLMAMAVAIAASEWKVTTGLKWPVAGFILLFWFFWSFKIVMPLLRGQQLPSDLMLPWFLPSLALLGLLSFVHTLRKYLGKEIIIPFDVLLPSATMALIFLAGRVVVVNAWEMNRIFGLAAIILAMVQFLLGWHLATRGASDRWAGIGGAFAAGALMLTLGLTDLTGGLGWAVMVWSPVAYGLLVLSGRCRSGSLRFISYLYQIIIVIIGLSAKIFSVAPEATIAAFPAAISLSIFSMIQYLWCRKNPPPDGSFFKKIDGKDFSSLALFLCGLVGLYFVTTMALDLVLTNLLTDPENAIKCGHSIIINCAAIIMLVLGGRLRNSEYIGIAVLFGVVGGINSFILDLFKGHGLPLVLSVLSFGCVAAIGSIVMGRWQKRN
ncbi:MAG: hypothetical protein KJ950_02420 [Proteobacteria bacterium]|nr:hypothetical protein [Pseudomonadota bacterium]MBU1686702.1 hypothetical protein [Pseudomonadota bacterium]